jgi:cytochrome P450
MQRLTGLDRMMTGYTEEMLVDWHDGDVRDVEVEMARLTVKIIVDAMFGARIDDERTLAVQEHLEPLGRRFEPNPFRFVVPDWVPTRENREYREAIDVLETVIDELVAERRGTESGDGDEPMDLLSILLRAKARGEQTDRQLRDELMTMLLAGHDTTALTLTYTWYLLSEHPDAKRQVHEELDRLLDGRPPTAADARQMEYVDRVLQEAMRLYPPVYMMFRQPRTDVRIGGYRIPEGAAVMLPQWVVHRSSRWYDDPGTFDPDRWTPDRRSARPRYAYFPFGAGPRHCIGKQFSLLEAKLILGTVAQRFSLDRVEEGPLALRGSLTMHPKDGMTMRLNARD